VISDISTFASCGNEPTVSIRVPVEFLVEILESLDDSEYKQELLTKLEFSARRCKVLAEALSKYDFTT
jgi:hypothetical protein